MNEDNKILWRSTIRLLIQLFHVMQPPTIFQREEAMFETERGV